jgi:hypothetical protein
VGEVEVVAPIDTSGTMMRTGGLKVCM